MIDNYSELVRQIGELHESNRLLREEKQALEEQVVALKNAGFAEWNEKSLLRAEKHAEGLGHKTCLLCLKRNQMLIHNSVIENMEASIASGAGQAMLDKLEKMHTALEQISKADVEHHAAGEYYIRNTGEYRAVLDKIRAIALEALKEDNHA